ncbi:MAG: winged-helix domain-containing protein [Planctomycetota bacterium]
MCIASSYADGGGSGPTAAWGGEARQVATLSAPQGEGDMPSRSKIPRPTVKRLSLYLRELERLSDHRQETISSKMLGSALGLTDAQVRKDLACFGQFGHPGIGYRVAELIEPTVLPVFMA